jgi:hypothetical protein
MQVPYVIGNIKPPPKKNKKGKEIKPLGFDRPVCEDKNTKERQESPAPGRGCFTVAVLDLARAINTRRGRPTNAGATAPTARKL